MSEAATEQQTNEPIGPIDEINSDSTVPEIVQWIREGIEEERIGSDVLRVIMDIPPVRRIPSDKIISALRTVLKEYAVQLPDDVMHAIEKGISDDFTFAAPAREKYLRPRNVMINTAPEVCTLMISGEEPVDGEPGFVEIHYDFSVKSGRMLPDGSIDFREINRFPQAKQGELLLRIYEPTDGFAGTDAYGWRVAPKPGEPVHIALEDNLNSTREYDEEKKRHYLDITARKSGIIVTDFGNDHPAPEHIRAISIRNQIELNDIDFTTGNVSGTGGELRCTADVQVKGDIRGLFSVLIEGKLNVGGTVEGQRVDASGEVVAHLVRSTVRSGRFIETVSATNAKLMADEYVQITREFTHCTIISPRTVFANEHGREILCGRALISTEEFVAENVDIRNRLEIVLGEKLLKQLSALHKSKEELETAITADDTHIKGRAHNFAKKLQLTYSLVPDEMKKNIIGIKNHGAKILSGAIPHEQAASDLDKLMNSLGTEYHQLLDQLKRIVQIQVLRQEKVDKLKDVQEQTDLVNEALSQMSVKIRGNLHPQGQVILRCGKHEKKWVGKASGPSSMDLNIGFDPESGFYKRNNLEEDQEG